LGWKHDKALGSEEGNVQRFNVEMNGKLFIEEEFLPHSKRTLPQI
jgi:hypothetical protein